MSKSVALQPVITFAGATLVSTQPEPVARFSQAQQPGLSVTGSNQTVVPDPA